MVRTKSLFRLGNIFLMLGIISLIVGAILAFTGIFDGNSYRLGMPMVFALIFQCVGFILNKKNDEIKSK